MTRTPRRGRRRVGEPAKETQQGFTLLELLVVLALVGLVTAVAFPNLERMVASVTRSTERDYILDQFAGLGRRAMYRGRTYVVFDAAGSPGSGGSGSVREEAGAPAGEEAEEASARSFSASFPDAYEAYAIDLPEGWEIRLDPPLVVRANGVCLGAALTLHHREEQEARIALDPPYCRVDPEA